MTGAKQGYEQEKVGHMWQGKGVDFDAFNVVHRPQWDRLKALSKTKNLTGSQADELIGLYQTVATHLSTVRSSAPDPSLISELSIILARARGRIAGGHDPQWYTIKDFVMRQVPAAFYRVRWWAHAVTVICIVIAVIFGVWVATTPQGLESVGPESFRLDYVNSAFASYYDPGADFAAMVWTNNAWIAAQCVAFGVTGVWPAFVMANNAVMVGSIGGMMAHYGELGLFLKLILPHGLLELTAIFVAGGAGLKLFWAWISPGNKPRSVALAQEGRTLILVAIGLVAVLGVSGLVEGFVTGSDLLWWVKILIGAIALAAFWAYVYILGRRAVAQGITGDLAAHQAGYDKIYAD